MATLTESLQQRIRDRNSDAFNYLAVAKAAEGGNNPFAEAYNLGRANEMWNRAHELREFVQDTMGYTQYRATICPQCEILHCNWTHHDDK